MRAGSLSAAVLVAVSLSVLPFGATPAEAQDTHLLTVIGLSGDPEYRVSFLDWGVRIRTAAVERFGLTRIFALPFAWNPASCRVLEKAGYVLEGRLRRSAVKDGRIVLPDGMSYHLLVLPQNQPISFCVLRKISELVRLGATVVGPRPTASPGLHGYPNADGVVKKLAEQLWGSCDGESVKEHKFGRGRVIWGKSLEEIQQAGLTETYATWGSGFINTERWIDIVHQSLSGNAGK